jgi:ornithine cyclodeaminase/alanine dehydrogenase-like protein (mu-crystallin family)
MHLSFPMNTNTLFFLSAADVRRALPMREAVDVMKAAFAALSTGEAVMPLRSHLAVPKHQGQLLLMPCYLPSADRLSLKVVTVFDGNPARGLPRIQALVTLFDGETGQPLAIMDGASLTALRTGARRCTCGGGAIWGRCSETWRSSRSRKCWKGT